MTDIVLSCNPFPKQVCIKITPDIRPTTGIADHAIANDLCAADNTRLAVAETSSQRDGLVTWINKVYKPTSDVRTGLILRAENTHHGGSITVQLTSCLTVMDFTKQEKLMKIQHNQSS